MAYEKQLIVALILGQIPPGQDECQKSVDCDTTICAYNCPPGSNLCFVDDHNIKRCKCCPEWEAVIHPPPTPPSPPPSPEA